MDQKQEENSNLLFSKLKKLAGILFWLFILALFIYWAAPSPSEIKEKFGNAWERRAPGQSYDQKIERAAKERMKDLSLFSVDKDGWDSLAKIIVAEEGWKLFSEEMNFQKIGHLNFPFTVNRLNAFRHKERDGETVIREQLFIFNSITEKWVSLSVLQTLHKDGEVFIMEELDAIYDSNPWEVDIDSILELLELFDE
jgi:hypothetical protein